MSEEVFALEDEALVVKGGVVRDVDGVRSKIEAAIEDGYGPCHSVFVGKSNGTGGEPMTLEQICMQSHIPHGQVQVATVGQLRAAGCRFEYDPSGGQGELHHNVCLPEGMTESDLQRFIDCFDEPVSNPHRAQGRQR